VEGTSDEGARVALFRVSGCDLLSVVQNEERLMHMGIQGLNEMLDLFKWISAWRTLMTLRN